MHQARLRLVGPPPFVFAFLLPLILGGTAITAQAQDKPTKSRKTTKTEAKATDKTAVRFTRVPDRGIQPQALVDGTGRLHLVYLGDDPQAANVYYVHQAAGAEAFSPPLRVNSQAGSAIAVGSIRGAHFALGQGNRVHVCWNGSNKAEPRGPGKYDSPFLYTRQAADQPAFEPQRAMNGTHFGLDGGGSVAADADGHVYVVWHSGDGTGEDNRRVWIAHSDNDGQEFAAPQIADAEKNGVCGCCGLRAFTDRQGTVYVLYRAAREQRHRDMFLLTSMNHGQSFEAIQTDRWLVANCPMSSQSLVDTGDAVLAAWETAGEIQVSRIDKKSRELAQPANPAGTSKNRKHPAMAVNGKGETLLVWVEGSSWEKGGSLAWQIFNEKGRPTSQKGRLEGAIPVWSFAAVYAEPDDSFVILH
ncbi:MAG: hypothetical protein JSS02_33925 [Planctomycetes bacterium]|nr:hypothetical protein [Planctomycetota bacterium]